MRSLRFLSTGQPEVDDSNLLSAARMTLLWFLWLLLSYARVSSFAIAPFAVLKDVRSWRTLHKQGLLATPSLESADLAPAVDRYPRLPSKSIASRLRLLAGIKPSGPDPFKLVSAELQPLSEYIKTLLVSENPVLTMAATHFFNRVI
jgi:hypothetical protein